MARTTDHSKKVNDLKSEIKVLKTKLKEAGKSLKTAVKDSKNKVVQLAESAYQKGYKQAQTDLHHLDKAFDSFMEKAAAEFEKVYFKKSKTPAKTKKTTKTAVAKTATAGKKRGRPRKAAAE